MPNLIEIFVLPPMAIARLGGSERPLENYEWRTDPTIHGASQTVIEPQTTLDVADDGSVSPYRPGVIRFRDGKDLRPVAPFFEIWSRVQYRDDDPEDLLQRAGAKPNDVQDTPLTASLLRAMGGDLSGVTYQIRLANHKAVRRTGEDANAFEAVLRLKGDDHRRTPLRAFTPPRPGLNALVSPERPIPLGALQILRPAQRSELGVDLDVLRLRYTPGRGQVFGPPSAVEARGTTTSELFEIVPPENRILNPTSSWLRYDGDYSVYTNPEPWDTYDGADQDDNVAWGVVDDTCDGDIRVSVVVGAARFEARARIAVGPPDYAPDRRPFVSLADDLADRDLEPADSADFLAASSERAALKASVTDLFQRVFETASLVNLDAIRARALGDNGGDNVEPPPRTDRKSMTVDDVGFADDRIRALTQHPPAGSLRFRPLVGLAHAPLAHDDELWSFIRNQADRARKMLRPAFGAFSDLATQAGSADASASTHRDPRIERDLLHDMRMPPYMRDEMARALSLTRRQYIEILRLIDALDAQRPQVAHVPGAPPQAIASVTVAGEESELRKRVRATLARARRGA